jgi:transposase InsO family protein
MSPQNYYARRKTRQRRGVDVALMLQLVRAERKEQPRLGGRKLYHLIGPELRAAGVKMGRDRFFTELRGAGYLVPPKRSPWPKTTRFDPNLPVFGNLVKRRKVTGRNQVWVADITYLRMESAFVFLALITDCWSHKIVGYHLGKTLETVIVLKALGLALKDLKGAARPIHHSDRGCQYASHAFVQAAKAGGLRLSMTEQQHHAENAMAERLKGILKQEYGLDETFANWGEVQRANARAIQLYNTRRPHLTLGMATPEAVHQAAVN